MIVTRFTNAQKSECIWKLEGLFLFFGFFFKFKEAKVSCLNSCLFLNCLSINLFTEVNIQNNKVVTVSQRASICMVGPK